MSIQKIVSLNFRNLESQEIELSSGINLFIGSNGMGKTNFLEAIYTACHSSSFRTHQTQNLLNFRNEDFELSPTKVQAIFKEDHVLRKLEWIQNSEKKWLQLDGKKISAKKVKNKFPVILFSPESLRCIKEEASKRRELIDTAMSYEPRRQQLITDFKKCLKQRNKALKDYSKDPTENLRSVAEQFSQVFIGLSFKLSHERILFLKDLRKAFEQAYKSLFVNCESACMNYKINEELSINPQTYDLKESQKLMEVLTEQYYKYCKIEYQTAFSLWGAHKHDISFLVDEKDSKTYCSQGQQRGLILSFKIAEVETRIEQHNQTPILLLDDVMSELDKLRRQHLLEYLENSSAQVVITTTDEKEYISGTLKPQKIYNIFNGKLTPIHT